MPQLVFVQPDGTRQNVDAAGGETVMLAAIRNNIRGIDAECGGALACATCHVHVDLAWIERLPPPDADELDMLDAVSGDRQPGSRLSCQIHVDPSLDGLVVGVPDSQG